MTDAEPPAAAARPKRPSVCHSCKATVVWVLLAGKRQPLDFLPDGGGNIAIEQELFAREPGVDNLARARVVTGVTTRYRRHIDNCPHAAAWRDRWKEAAPRPFSPIKRKKTR